jgi:hypothetical protein
MNGSRLCLDNVRRSRWLPFLNTYRTMCLAPEPGFRRVLEEIAVLQTAYQQLDSFKNLAFRAFPDFITFDTLETKACAAQASKS